MKLTYCQIEHGNFGDDLNPWLWPRVAPGLCDDDPREEFLGIGSILADTYPLGPRRIVFGSGAGYKRPPVIDERWKVYCVRGPQTAAALKIDPELAITDAAALVATLPWKPVEQVHDVSYMPHHLSAELGDWQTACRCAGIHYIAPGGDVADTIDQIRQSKLLITEALHGAVVADALRIAWIPVRAYGHILPFKWRDWTQSLDLTYEPHHLPSLWQQPMSLPTRVAHLTKRVFGYLPHGKEKWRWAPWRSHGPTRIAHIAEQMQTLKSLSRPLLSDAATHDRVVSRLAERLDRLKHDYGCVNRESSRAMGQRSGAQLDRAGCVLHGQTSLPMAHELRS